MTSIITSQINDIYTATDKAKALELFNKLVDESARLNAKTKYAMKINAARCGTLIQLQTYVTNSMFKFEGMGVR